MPALREVLRGVSLGEAVRIPIDPMHAIIRNIYNYCTYCVSDGFRDPWVGFPWEIAVPTRRQLQQQLGGGLPGNGIEFIFIVCLHHLNI